MTRRSRLRRCFAWPVAVLLAVAAYPVTAHAVAAHRDWITLAGTVTKPDPRSFVLDYGKGTILVEMDSWSRPEQARDMVAGQHAVVTGAIDKDLFQRRALEARSVYVRETGLAYYASPADEEQWGMPYSGFFFGLTQPAPLPFIALTGIVKSVSGRQMVLDTGDRQVTVETLGRAYDVKSGELEPIQPGERVSVSGIPESDVVATNRLKADTVIRLGPRGSRHGK